MKAYESDVRAGSFCGLDAVERVIISVGILLRIYRYTMIYV